MKIAIVTGSSGLIGAATVRRLCHEGWDRVIGIDNDMRSYFFGAEASTDWSRRRLEGECSNFTHCPVDIRDPKAIETIFAKYNSDIKLIVHTAAQPSHDWAAKEPLTDFSVNATGTMVMLEATRKYCPDSVFILTSTNKVYGDTPNSLPLLELDGRWEIDSNHPYYQYGIDESMSIDQCKHSLFGASKAAADLITQEYGRYFGLKTAIFRGGCLTGPGHSGAQLHGFLAYLMKCVIEGKPYTVFGYKGKQVRDNIHCDDLVECFIQFYNAPRVAEVYNIGGSRFSNCSMIEAIEMSEKIAGKKLSFSYAEDNRIGDHIWWISDVRKFQSHYPQWKYKYNIKQILEEICQDLSSREQTHTAVNA